MKQVVLNERIHKGFRVWLFETGIRVQRTDFTNADEGRKMASELLELINTLDRKYLLETQFFFPALALQAPFSVSLLEDEKREAETQSRMLGRLVRQYLQPGVPGHFQKTGIAIQEAFCKMVSFLMVYMNHQDAMFREIAGQAPDSPGAMDDLDEMLHHNGGSHDTLSVIMLKGMNVNELLQWLDTQTGQTKEQKWALIEDLDSVTGQTIRNMRKNGITKLRLVA